ncbi:MAG: TonB-dependent receptor plug domain-containing protein [Balneola sp.]
MRKFLSLYKSGSATRLKPILLQIIAVSICLFAPISELCSQDNSVLRVIVISEEDGSPLLGANALLYEIDQDLRTEPVSYCITNEDGLCEIRDIISNTEYSLKITYVGFKTYSVPILLESDQTKVLRVGLKPEIGDVGELTVERQRYITTGEVGIRRISIEDVSRIPTPGVDGDLASYLKTIPGVVSSGDRGGDLFIRGGTPVQNKSLVDNLPIIKPFHISNLFSAFPEEIVQSADLYAGGFGAEYSGVTSAILDVRLRPGNMKEFKSSAAVSPYMGTLFMEGPLEKDKQSFFLLARKSVIDKYGPTLTGEEIPLEFSDIIARYFIRADNIACSITGIRTSDSGEIVPFRNINSSWKNTVLGARCLGFDEGYNFPIEFTAGYTNYENKEGSAENTERYSSISKFHLSTDRVEKFFGLRFNYGFGFTIDTYKTTLSERFTSVSSFEENIPILNMYTEAEWNANSKLIIKPGFVTQISTYDSPTIEPRIRVSYNPDGTDRREISLAGGNYVQIFSGISDERDVGTIFTILKPVEVGDPYPSAIHAIIGYKERWRYLKMNIEGYTKKHSNIAVSKWTPQARTEIETALADGFTYGFDIILSYNKTPLFASVSYGYSKVEYEAVSGDLGAWIQDSIFSYSPAQDQRHKLNTILGLNFFGFKFNSSWEFGSGKPYTQIFGYDLNIDGPFEDPAVDPGTARILFNRPYGERLPYYHRLDVSLGRSIDLSSTLTIDSEIGAINVYNRRNIFNFAFSTLQRVDQTPLLPYLSFKLQVN